MTKTTEFDDEFRIVEELTKEGVSQREILEVCAEPCLDLDLDKVKNYLAKNNKDYEISPSQDKHHKIGTLEEAISIARQVNDWIGDPVAWWLGGTPYYVFNGDLNDLHVDVSHFRLFFFIKRYSIKISQSQRPFADKTLYDLEYSKDFRLRDLHNDLLHNAEMHYLNPFKSRVSGFATRGQKLLVPL